MGCGVTAYDYDDALGLLKTRVFKGEIPAPKSVNKNIDVSTFNSGHILA